MTDKELETRFDVKNLHKNSYENGKALLTELVDPADRFDGEMFYDHDPRTKGSSFKSYPFIIIRDFSATPESKTVNGQVREWSASIEFEVFSIDDGNKEFDAGDVIADDLTSFIFGNSTNVLGRDAEMTQPGFESNERFTGVNKDQQPITRREIVFSFNLHLSPYAERGGN